MQDTSRGPRLTVDTVIVKNDNVILIKRKYPPFEGVYALIGGHVETGENVYNAAKREAREETGLEIGIDKMIGVYSNPDRDPREHVVTIAFTAYPIGDIRLRASDEGSIAWFDLNTLPVLAFDHSDIIRDAKVKCGFASPYFHNT